MDRLGGDQSESHRRPADDGLFDDVARDLDGAVDRLLDGDIDAEERRSLRDLIRTDESAHDEYRAMRRIANAIADDPQETNAPDFTDIVLTRVGRRNGFLGRRQRRLVTVGRVALAAGLVLAGAAAAMWVQHRPEAFELSNPPRPIAAIDEAVRDEAALARETIAEAATGLDATERVLYASCDSVGDGERAREVLALRLKSLDGGVEESWTAELVDVGDLRRDHGLDRPADAVSAFVFTQDDDGALRVAFDAHGDGVELALTRQSDAASRGCSGAMTVAANTSLGRALAVRDVNELVRLASERGVSAVLVRVTSDPVEALDRTVDPLTLTGQPGEAFGAWLSTPVTRLYVDDRGRESLRTNAGAWPSAPTVSRASFPGTADERASVVPLRQSEQPRRD